MATLIRRDVYADRHEYVAAGDHYDVIVTGYVYVAMQRFAGG